MIVVDTTILVYAVGADHHLRGPCRELIDAVRVGRVQASTTAEVIQEFVHVRARRRTRDDAVALGRDYAALLAPLTPVDEEDLAAGLDLYASHAELGAFDSVLAAAAARRRTAAVVSADAAFAAVPRIRHLTPASPAFMTQVASLSTSGAD